MKHIINNIARQGRALMIALLTAVCISATAQITSVHGTVSDDFGPLMGATVCEIDGNGRIIESTVADMNGNFTMKIKNEKDKIRFSFVGLKTQTMKIDRTTYDIVLESATTLQEVTVKSKKRMTGAGLPIPEREVAFAKQSISTKEFEGMGMTSIDEALQGRIAGLDIITSGDIGAGSTIRLRGASSLSSFTDGNPLIVVDGNIRDVSGVDLSSNAEQNLAEALNINPNDIEDLNILQDGAGVAIYGPKAAAGVIEITTKRGKKGKATLTYNFTLRAGITPKGYDLLSGDDYTMLLKESYFNPQQSSEASNVPEINYDPTWKEFLQYNNNTDWRKAVKRVGILNQHYITVSGGGEKANFRVSAGIDDETRHIIGQSLTRFTTRMNLDYTVSQRIRVQTNFEMKYTKDNSNRDLLGMAQRKMPNMSIYEKDANGNDTEKYYNMLQSGPFMGSEIFKDDQRNLLNPVAVGNLEKNTFSRYDITPELVLNYELLGLDEEHTRLTWRAQVYMNIYNGYREKFTPSELVSTSWTAGHNSSYIDSNKSVGFTTKQTLTLTPYFRNKDHSLMAMGRFELSTGSSNYQNTNGSGLPSGGIENPNAGGLVTGLGSGYGEWKNMSFAFNTHYAYKGGRYVADFAVNVYGTTKLGPKHRWITNPYAALRWNIIDEPFMQKIREKGLNMLGVRASWAYNADIRIPDYLYTSTYSPGAQYMGMGSYVPQNLKLNNLKPERVTNLNFGVDLGVFEKVTMALNVYTSTRKDMLMGGYRVPSSTGFYSVAVRNTGKMRNTGWDFNINTNNLIKKGKFTMDFNVNFNNNRSTLLEMDETVLKDMNGTFTNVNNQVLNRVQLNNPLNSIYGFRSKGVYQYNYKTIKEIDKRITAEQAATAGIQGWNNMTTEQKQQAWISAGHTAPVALNADGQIIRDANGDPLRMKFNYSNDGTGRNYDFSGGDAMYEDVNHDGQINALDIVYLGSSLPKLMGGFGFTATYKDWRLSTFFEYRIGSDVINRARLGLESMMGNDNQSQAVNYRWRKEGDVTEIPRAMYGATSNYNTLLSDRFVESSSFVRCNSLSLSYTFRQKMLKKVGIPVKNIRMGLTAQNLFTLTGYTGIDPKIQYGGYSPAIDYGQTPPARQFTLNINVDF